MAKPTKVRNMKRNMPVTDKTAFFPNRLYTIRRGSIQAFGRPTGNGKAFVVFAGSVARLRETDNFSSQPPSLSKARRYRTFLVDEGVLEPCDGCLVFTQDFVFPSPSNAATVVLGNPSNGNDWWKPLNLRNPMPAFPGLDDAV